jgi:hypothetical protein
VTAWASSSIHWCHCWGGLGPILSHQAPAPPHASTRPRPLATCHGDCVSACPALSDHDWGEETASACSGVSSRLDDLEHGPQTALSSTI